MHWASFRTISEEVSQLTQKASLNLKVVMLIEIWLVILYFENVLFYLKEMLLEIREIAFEKKYNVNARVKRHGSGAQFSIKWGRRVASPAAKSLFKFQLLFEWKIRSVTRASQIKAADNQKLIKDFYTTVTTKPYR